MVICELVTKTIDLDEIVKQKIALNCAYLENQFKESVEVITPETGVGFARLARVVTGYLITPVSSAEILENVLTIGIPEDDSMSIVFNFTAGDLVDGKLTRTHNFNQSVVDVSVSDNLGKEIMVGVEFLTPNTVQLDFRRVQVVDLWKVLIEK